MNQSIQHYLKLQEGKLKKLIVILLAAVAVVSVSFPAFAGKDASVGKVTAYYFHGSFRCPTCTAMEKYSKDVIDGNFKEALQSGRVEFKAINVEERENEHFVNDYKLYAKSLILSLVKNGKEIKSKNLNKIWEYAHNKQKFSDYVSKEVADFLKEAQ